MFKAPAVSDSVQWQQESLRRPTAGLVNAVGGGGGVGSWGQVGVG